jgi:hypothetical protein
MSIVIMAPNKILVANAVGRRPFCLSTSWAARIAQYLVFGGNETSRLFRGFLVK